MKKNNKNIRRGQANLFDLLKRPHIAICLTVLVITLPCLFFMPSSLVIPIILGAFGVLKKIE
jgi:hypothetical protein